MEVLVSSMNKDMSLFKKMNIQTNAIIINQTPDISGNFSYKQQIFDDKTWKFYSMSEKGVGRSRNNALMRASDDIVIMADEDEVFVDGYEKIINDAYSKYPDADMIVFDVRVHNGDEIKHRVKRDGRVKFFNSFRYGTVTFTFKRDILLNNNIYFSLLFGGGSRFLSGEDSLFITDVLKKKLKVYSYNKIIADVYNESSSWFSGYNKEYFFDRGALYYAISKNYYLFLILQFWLRRARNFNSALSEKEKVKTMLQGAMYLKRLK
ncbi:glycosyltransferase [Enterococcus faecium]|nr:glycosyltransferase [Enterococcus faecium]